MTGQRTGAERLSVVVVNFNGARLLPACLNSLARQTLPREEVQVVVVDNASTDESLRLLATSYPWVEVVASGTNVGFAAGCNLGIAHSRAGLVLLLNPDATAEPDALEQLVAAAADPGCREVAAFAGRVLLSARFSPDAQGPVRTPRGRFRETPHGAVRLVNSTGNVVRTDGLGVDRGWLRPADEHHPPAEVFGFSGAACLLRKGAVDGVGGFDEKLFMYYEDTDLSWRLRLAGWRVRYCERAVFSHWHSATSVEGSQFFRFHDERNRLLVLTKNASLPLVAGAVLRFPVSTVGWMRQGRSGRTRARVRVTAFASYLRLLPRALADRRRISRSAVVPRSAVEELLVRPQEETGGSYRGG
ncbi:MAG: glycosyltransferase family 2 protein [Actinomycetes bacterium]